MIICDSHTHSSFSFDAEVPMEDMVKGAIKKNINVITFTDHCDAIGIYDEKKFDSVLEQEIPKSVAESKRLKEVYSDKIKVLTGVELGEPTHSPEKTKVALDLGDYDFILASTHEVRGREDFYFLEYNENNIDTLLSEYFNEQLEVVKWNGFDSLAHFDYPARYIAERTDIKPDYSKYNNVIDEILTTLIKNNKALEINTSTISKTLSRPMPDKNILKRYKELGGYLITLGSDAHNVEALSQDFNKAFEILKELGFTSYYYYEKHNPVKVNLL